MKHMGPFELIYRNLRLFFGWVSNTKVFGIIPLDNILHFLIGLFLYGTLRNKLSPIITLSVVFLIALSKEAFDWLGPRFLVAEAVKDIAFTMAMPLIWITIHYIKKKSS